MKIFLNIGRLLAILILGFTVSVLVSMPAIAGYQTLGISAISAISGDVPIVEDLKSLDQIGDYLTLDRYPGLVPNFFHQNNYKPSPPLPSFTGPLTQRGIMLNIAYS